MAIALNNLIGAAMRTYRRSPFYPKLGHLLGKMLHLVVRFRKDKIVVKEIGGVKFELDLEETIDASLYYSGTFEIDAEKKLASLVKPNMVALDIGANVGYHTFRLAQLVGANGSVHAIEPTSRAFARLRKNADLNAFENLTLHRLGLSDQDYGLRNVTFQSSYRLDGGIVNLQEETPIMRLDSFVREQGLKSVDFIKMDVDGFESRVFQGAIDTLTMHQPAVYFEFGAYGIEQLGDSPSVIFDILKSLHYRVFADDGTLVADADGYLRKCGHATVNLTALPGHFHEPA